MPIIFFFIIFLFLITFSSALFLFTIRLGNIFFFFLLFITINMIAVLHWMLQGIIKHLRRKRKNQTMKIKLKKEYKQMMNKKKYLRYVLWFFFLVHIRTPDWKKLHLIYGFLMMFALPTPKENTQRLKYDATSVAVFGFCYQIWFVFFIQIFFLFGRMVG